MRDTGHFVGGVRVLDLAKCASASAVDGVSLIQGLRTTAAFFTFLRANLTLNTSGLSPNPSIPIALDPWDPDALDLSHLSIPSLPGRDLSLRPDSTYPSSPTSTAATTTTTTTSSSSSSSSPKNDAADRRRPRQDGRRRSRSLHGANALALAADSDGDNTTTELLLEPLTSQADRAAGLALVAASIAQMDHRAASALALHPACLTVLAACWAAAYRFWALRSSLASAGAHDFALLALLLCTAAATYLTAIRHFTSAYTELAEGARRSFLHPDDILLGARRHDTLVGVLVLRLEPRGSTAFSLCRSSSTSTSTSTSTSMVSSSSSSSSSSKRRSTRPPSLRGGNGVVRAWTTRLGHRRAGVGRALLDAAVRATKDRCGRDAQVGFAREHAHSAMVLPGVFNGCFRGDEMRAARALEEALGQWGARRPGKPKGRGKR